MLKLVATAGIGFALAAIVYTRLDSVVEERPFVREQPSLAALSASMTGRFDLDDKGVISCYGITLYVTLEDDRIELLQDRVDEHEFLPRDRKTSTGYRWTELAARLRALKADPYFVDRTDLLVGARASHRPVSYQALITALAIAQQAGFVDAQLYDPDQRDAAQL
jgi:hypothetical protein